VQLHPPRDELQRRVKARRVAGGEQLLGIRPEAVSGTAHLGRWRELDVELAVIARGVAVTSALGRGVRGVEHLRQLDHPASFPRLPTKTAPLRREYGVGNCCPVVAAVTFERFKPLRSLV